MQAKYISMEVQYVSELGWLDGWSSIYKGIDLSVYIAHVYLDRIVPRVITLSTCTWMWMQELAMNMKVYATMWRIWYDEVCICVVSKCCMWKVSSCLNIYTHMNEFIMNYVWYSSKVGSFEWFAQ